MRKRIAIFLSLVLLFSMGFISRKAFAYMPADTHFHSEPVALDLLLELEEYPKAKLSSAKIEELLPDDRKHKDSEYPIKDEKLNEAMKQIQRKVDDVNSELERLVKDFNLENIRSFTNYADLNEMMTDFAPNNDGGFHPIKMFPPNGKEADEAVFETKYNAKIQALRKKVDDLFARYSDTLKQHQVAETDVITLTNGKKAKVALVVNGIDQELYNSAFSTYSANQVKELLFQFAEQKGGSYLEAKKLKLYTSLEINELTNLSYEFRVSGTDSSDGLPNEIKALTPQDDKEYVEGQTVSAKQPEKTEMKDTEGNKWIFKGYTSNEITLDGDSSKNVFVGLWEKEKPLPASPTTTTNPTETKPTAPTTTDTTTTTTTTESKPTVPTTTSTTIAAKPAVPETPATTTVTKSTVSTSTSDTTELVPIKPSSSTTSANNSESALPKTGESGNQLIAYILLMSCATCLLLFLRIRKYTNK